MKNQFIKVVLMVFCFFSTMAQASQLPDNFSDVQIIEKSILVEMRYAGFHNFVGEPIAGYLAPKCILTTPAAMALARAQKEFLKQGLSLKMYDCYRPQRAVDHFVRWANDLADTLMKAEFYPGLAKSELIPEYIATKSGHSRGSTFDLTLVALPAAEQEIFNPANLKDCRANKKDRFGDNSIDMGTGYDCFDALAHTDNPSVGAEVLKNRHLLVDTLKKYGFDNYSQEWWHFTLRNEPFPQTYFDFEVK